jgi:uncharacterized protein (DUF58 family)
MNLIPVLLTMLVIAFFTGSHSLFYLAYVLGGLMVLSRLWLPAALAKVQSKRCFPARAYFGEEVAVELQVSNQGRLPVLWLTLHESLPTALHVPPFERRVVSLASGDVTTLCYTLDCRRRGFYSLGPLSLQSGDFFHLAPDRRKQVPEDVFIVYPKILPLPKLRFPSQIPFGDLPTHVHFFEDPTRFFGLRDYQAGDSLRLVDWKSSARQSELQVRRFEPAVSLRSMIFLDLNADVYSIRCRPSAEEMGCTLAASIAVRLVKLRQHVGLALLCMDEVSEYTGLQTLPLGHGRGHAIRLLEMLASAKMAPTPSLPTILPRASAGMGWGSTALVITSGKQPDLLPALLQMRRRGFHVMLIATDPTVHFLDLEARLRYLGIPALWITREKDLDVWR